MGRRRGVGGERNWGLIIVAVAVVAVIAAFIAVVAVDFRSGAASGPPGGVEDFEVPSRQHAEGTVGYAQTPPVGGNHNPVWQNCGFYSEPIRNENAVHSLEHGAVWITYRPGLAQEQVDQIQQLASDNSYVLASPYPDLPAPVVASAWGKQLQLDSADASSLKRFVSAFAQGPQTPEPGAVCTGGTGTPE
ncbi:MAG: DUF3105 domain-containing protein [Rubrobacteraceae bacterium]